jgi:hypothetical protein
MKTIAKWAAITIGGLLVLSFVIGFAQGLSDDDEPLKPATVTVRSEPPPPEPEPEPVRTREDPDPNGKYDLDCNYELGDFGEFGDPSRGYRFVAGGTLENTGNIGIRVRVTYTWKLLGRSPLTVRKHYRVRRGQSRDVNLTVPVSQDDIDSHQNAHGDCSTKASIVSTFGDTPFED